jgi:NADPH-dependent 7-cyano-7-deazaguanine reductase QueF
MMRYVFCGNALAAHANPFVIRVEAASMRRSGVPMTPFRLRHHFNCIVPV